MAKRERVTRVTIVKVTRWLGASRGVRGMPIPRGSDLELRSAVTTW